MSFPSSIFDPAPQQTSSLENEYQKLKELQSLKSKYLLKIVDLDSQIQEQINKIGQYIDEDEVVILGSSSRDSNFTSSQRELPRDIPIATTTRREIPTSRLESRLESPPHHRPVYSRPSSPARIVTPPKTQSRIVDNDSPQKRPRTDSPPQLLHSLKQYIIGKTERKSRSLLLPQPNHTTAISTSLDGKLHLWDIQSEQRIKVIEREQWMADKGWCEDVKWVGPNALILAHSSGSDQLTLFQLSSSRKKTLPNIHAKHVNVVTSIGDLQFVSAGLDKKLILWDVRDGERNHRIHDEHSSKIHDLCHVKEQNRLYSGGQDSRLLCTDLETKRVLFGHDRLDGAVRDVLQIPNTNSLVTFVQDPLFTVRVFDPRNNTFAIKIPTRVHQVDGYQRIRIHPNGYLVTVPIPAAGGGFEVYDLRYAKVQTEKGQSLHVDKLRVLEAQFLNNKIWCLTTNHVEILEYR